MACPHNNVQQYTEVCLDCGANIYETPSERVERLNRDIAALRNEQLVSEGDRLEEERDALRRALRKDPGPQDSGW